MFYRRDGTPYPMVWLPNLTVGQDVLKWAEDYSSIKRFVANSKLWWGGTISTIFLGFDHNPFGSGPPILFETMVFAADSEALDLQRYCNESEALIGHLIMVDKWKFNKYVAGVIIKRHRAVIVFYALLSFFFYVSHL